ncbi:MULTISPECIES: hypothetical protein [Idiomarina]|uniref:hypothetical protein n=1 Tax=Idiomarina TaxID=135575 RepID=UPI00129B0A81|nr:MULTISPECIES: hypothetical protein [Idiomarina]MRJ40994.1 hypothetical protein [Idiomarina sp. FeN1]NCU56159.1 hypothetical protein [Idiomarina sp. FenA--70]NCU59178.1 hypothetical protein [Idiomarina sp. FenBw--71]UUN14855.1 hypothetical protein KGF88_06670 [Idiomarina loihiensis]
MHKLTHVIYLAIIGALVIALVVGRSAPMPPVASIDTDMNTAAENTSAAASVPSTSLTVGNDAVRNTDSAAAFASDSSTQPQVAASTQEQQDVAQELDLSDAQLARLAELLKTRNQQEIEMLLDVQSEILNSENISERLHTEAIDQDWAYVMTSEIENLYAQQEDLQGAEISDIQCRTTVCEVSISGSNLPFDYMMKFHKALVQSPQLGPDYKTMMISNSLEGSHKIQIIRPQP